MNIENDSASGASVYFGHILVYCCCRIKPSTSYSTRAGTSRDAKVSVPGPSRSTSSALRNGRRARFVSSSTTEEDVDVTGPSTSRGIRLATVARATRAAPSPASKLRIQIKKTFFQTRVLG